MDFEERARKAHRRGQLVRAAVLLAEGLKRHPERVDALDFLTNLFANELESPGLEQDLMDAMAAQQDLRERLEFILERYAERDKQSMGRELVRAANERFGGFQWPPPTPASELSGEGRRTDDDDTEAEVRDRESESTAAAPPMGEADAIEPEPEPEATPQASPSDKREIGDPAQLFEESLRAAQERLSADEAREPRTAQAPSDAPPKTDVAEAPTQEHPRAESTNRTGDSSESGGPDLARLLLVALAAVALVGAVYGGWTYLNSGENPPDVDVEKRDIAALDTADRGEVPEVLGAKSGAAVDTEAARQAEFIEAIYAVDWGETLSGELSGDGRFAVGYGAVYHAQRGDFEQAIASVTRLEQRFPGELTTIWARGMLEEFRGHHETAAQTYQLGSDKFSSFVPFHTGLVRIRARQGRTAAEAKIFDTLRESSPEHPYLVIEHAVWPSAELLFDGERADKSSRHVGVESEEPSPRIVRAVAKLQTGLLGEPTAERLDMVAEAVELEPEFAPAQLYLGVLRAEALEVDEAEASLEAAAQVEGAPNTFRWLLIVTGQQVLAAAGRPDRALRFAVPFELKGVDADAPSAELVPESIMGPIPAGVRLESPLAIRAMGLRSLLLAELGLVGTAEACLESARTLASSTDFLDFVEVQLHIVEGNRNEAIRARRQMSDGPYRELALAAVSYHDGDYEVAIDAGELALGASSARNLAARYTALSLAAGGKVRQALAQLENWSSGPALQADFRALKMRVLSRVDPDAADVENGYEGFLEAEPTGVHRRIDLAGTDFWRKRFSGAVRHLEDARELAPSHPEVNWVLSLVARSSESAGDVKGYLSESWRPQSGDASLLLELGQIQLDLGRYPQARQLFYRALLADRTSIEAIRGMGRAYLGYDPARGRRDMADFVDHYGTDSRALAPKAEVLRWLAVLHGVRKGDDKGYSYLEDAVALVGETPPLLVERARFNEASGNTAAARRAFARALERNSSFASAHLGLARTALDSGDESVARTHLARFLALGGNGESAEWARERLDALQSATADAAEE
ncbi:MAG: tetratricopeptide repeat protein [Myxococcota bacterium]